MKHILSLIVVAMLLLTACNNKQHEADMAAAQRTADSLQAIVDAKDSEINTLFEVLNQIEDNLALISSKYGSVKEMKRGQTEANYSVKTEIADQMQNIEKMLAANKQKIAELNAKIKTMGKENAALQDFVAKLEQRITEQETQIADLQAEIEGHKTTIRQLNENVSVLTAQNEAKDRTIATQIATANKAYFIVGTYDDLNEAGVVAKQGGFIGIGRKQMLQANLPVQKFVEIDRTVTTTIEVNMKNAVVISSHPESSYEMVASDENDKVTAYIRILDPNLFWRNTKYLVVSTK